MIVSVVTMLAVLDANKMVQIAQREFVLTQIAQMFMGKSGRLFQCPVIKWDVNGQRGKYVLGMVPIKAWQIISVMKKKTISVVQGVIKMEHSVAAIIKSVINV